MLNEELLQLPQNVGFGGSFVRYVRDPIGPIRKEDRTILYRQNTLYRG